MGVPKHRGTKSKRNQRRMHLFLEEKVLVKCDHCKNPRLPHTVCEFCGYYKGREVINVLAKLEKKEKKQREKEIKQAEKEKKEEQKQRPMTLEELSRRKF